MKFEKIQLLRNVSEQKDSLDFKSQNTRPNFSKTNEPHRLLFVGIREISRTFSYEGEISAITHHITIK